MTTHRTNYTPAPAPPRRRGFQIGIKVWLLIIAALLVPTAVTLLADTVDPRPQPPAFPVEQLDGQALAQIRVEAFRAGQASARDDNCPNTPLLAHPLGRLGQQPAP